MKMCKVLLKERDLKEARHFYEDLFHMDVSADFGDNIVFREGLVIEKGETDTVKKHSYAAFDGELYFETDYFCDFLKRLKRHDVYMVSPLFERDFGQRAIRFTDPSGHLIEVAESERCLARRLKEEGYTVEDIAKKMHLLDDRIWHLVS